MQFLEREKGFEPSTFSLARRRSTPEPLPLNSPARGVLYTISMELRLQAAFVAGQSRLILSHSDKGHYEVGIPFVVPAQAGTQKLSLLRPVRFCAETSPGFPPARE